MRRGASILLGIGMLFGLVLSGLVASVPARAAGEPSQWLFFPHVPRGEYLGGTGPWYGAVTIQNLESEAVILDFSRSRTARVDDNSITFTLQPNGAVTLSAAQLGVAGTGSGVAVRATWSDPSGKLAPPRITGITKRATPAVDSFQNITDGTMQMVDGYGAIPQADVAWGSNTVICGSGSNCNQLDGLFEGVPQSVLSKLEFDGRSFLPIVQANWFGWNTFLHLSNVDASGDNATVHVTFYRAASHGGGQVVGPITLQIDRGGTAVVDVAGQLAQLGITDGFVGSAVISSDRGVVASATRVKAETQMALTNTAGPLPYLDVDLNASQLENAGANPGVAGAGYTLYAPLVFHNYNGWNTGINIVNASDVNNTVTVAIYGRDGSSLGLYSREIPPWGMEYVYIPEVSDLAANDYGTAVLSAGAPFHAVVDEVKYETGEAMAFLAIQANSHAGSSRTATVGLPLYHKGTDSGRHGDTSGLNLFNPSTQAVSGVVSFHPVGGGNSLAQVPFNLAGRGTTTIYAPEVAGLPAGGTYGATVQAQGGNGTLVAVSNVVNYDVSHDGGAVFNVTNPLGQFRLACTEAGCGYTVKLPDGSFRVLPPWGGGDPSAVPSSMSITGAQTVSIDDEAEIKATVRDQRGQVIPGAKVSFTVTGVNSISQEVTAANDGVATFKYASTKIGRDTITASAGQASAQTTVDWTTGAPATVELAVEPTDNPVVNTEITLTATVKDKQGNLLPDVEVTFGTDADSERPNLSKTATTGTSGDALGVATVTDTQTKAGVDTWRAVVNDDVSSNLIDVTWKAGEPAKVVLSVDPTTEQIGGSLELTATVTDQWDNVVTDATGTVAFAGVLEGQADQAATGTLNNGVATATYTDGLKKTGTQVWTATYNDILSNTVEVTWTPGPQVGLELTATVDPTVASMATVTATVVDEGGNTVTNATGTVFFSSTGVNGALGPMSATVIQGQAQINYVGGQVAGTDTWTAAYGAYSATVDINWQAAGIDRLVLTASMTDAAAGAPVELTATLYDQYDNVITRYDGNEVTFTRTGENDGVVDYGELIGGAAQITDENPKTGTDTWTAEVDLGEDGTFTSNDVTITRSVGAPAKISFVQTELTRQVGTEVVVRVLVTDEYDNPVVGEPVVLTRMGVNSETVTKITNANGFARFDYTSSTSGTDTLSAALENDSSVVTEQDMTVEWVNTLAAKIMLDDPTTELDWTNPIAGDEVAFEVTILNSEDQPLEDVPVTLLVMHSGGVTSVPADTTTDANGKVTIRYAHPIVEQDVTILATADAAGVTIASDSIKVSWEPKPIVVTRIELEVDRTTQQIGKDVVFTVTLFDEDDNVAQVTGDVTVTASGLHNGQTVTVSLTNGTGTGTFTGVASLSDDNQDTWKVTYGGVDSNEVTVTWTAGDPDTMALSVLSTGGAPYHGSTIQSVGEEIRFRVKVTDSAGNPVGGQQVFLRIKSGGAHYPGSEIWVIDAGTTAQNGVVFASWTGTTIGVDTWEAVVVVDGIELASPTVTVTWATMTGTLTNNELKVGEPTTATLTIEGITEEALSDDARIRGEFTRDGGITWLPWGSVNPKTDPGCEWIGSTLSCESTFGVPGVPGAGNYEIRAWLDQDGTTDFDAARVKVTGLTVTVEADMTASLSDDEVAVNEPFTVTLTLIGYQKDDLDDSAVIHLELSPVGGANQWQTEWVPHPKTDDGCTWDAGTGTVTCTTDIAVTDGLGVGDYEIRAWFDPDGTTDFDTATVKVDGVTFTAK